MDDSEINLLLDRLDGSGSDREMEAASKLRVGVPDLPKYLLQRYRISRKWRPRGSCVYRAMRYAKESKDAFVLGLEALFDRSRIVRHSACMLLAYSLNPDALDALSQLAETSQDTSTVEDAKAAIDAIKNRNHNYFVDREHSGKITLNIC
ncbi:hypothetical protein O5O45_31885 [Hahella aquimaris]|uniref:hypothetical protein n=1 Tax=Hahella sp. HNIBRBA332 TaxID=3015983 RepID=UPI00273BFDE1|nr:hypothetical protein [Hahella sp. HNIBRBA332]WLQ14320.1 hypothetical protein O5O45_31885 [Hahella sp. HNIBRBA332]